MKRGQCARCVELAAEVDALKRHAQRAPTLTLLSPSNLPMEDDPDVLQVARAIAERGVGRYWDDFPETDAFDTDQGDLIEYARAAVEIFRRTAPQPASAAQRPLPPVAGWRVKLDNGWVLYEREREARDSLFARTGSPVEPLYALTATSSVVHAQCAAPSEVLEQICQITNVGRGDVLSLQDALHEIHRIATAALTSTECGEDNG